MNKIKYLFAGLIALLILAVTVNAAVASISFKSATGPVGTYEVNTLLSATTTNATSTNLTGGGGYALIGGAKNVTVYFSRGDTTGTGNSGSNLFKLQVSPDGSTWNDYSRLRQATTTNNANDFAILAGSGTISAATSTLTYSMETLGFYAVRCISVETTDGEATCKVGIER